MKWLLVILLIVAGIVIIDAVMFTRNSNQRIEPVGLPLDNEPFGEGACAPPSKCTAPSTNAECYRIACLAKKCKGDYSSGECKDLKELHEINMCELAKPGCGDELPSIRVLACGQWWQYACRIRLATGGDQVYTP